jgi:hypothetical protein
MVESTDAGAGTFVVRDLMTKKTVTIRTTPDSDMRKLDPQMAQMIAMRLKGGAGQAGGANGAGEHRAAEAGGAGAAQGQAGAHAAGANGNGGGLARVLQHSPEIHVSDLHKGDAVIIVATSGNPDTATAIHLVSGVEPMLRASAKGSQNMLSSAWNLGGGSAGGDEGGGEGNP